MTENDDNRQQVDAEGRTTSRNTNDKNNDHSSNDNNNTTVRLHAINQLLQRYKDQQKKQQQQSVGVGAGSSYYYVHDSLYYTVDKYGGICGQVSSCIKKGDVLLVLPGKERLSYTNFVKSSSQSLFLLDYPKSLITYYIPKIIKECENHPTTPNLKDQVDIDNIIVALLIMFLWRRRKQQEIERENDDDKKNIIGNEEGNVDQQEHQQEMEKMTSNTNLDLFLQTWPTTQDIETQLVLQEENYMPELQNTYAIYYIKTRNELVQNVILPTIWKILQEPETKDGGTNNKKNKGKNKKKTTNKSSSSSSTATANGDGVLDYFFDYYSNHDDDGEETTDGKKKVKTTKCSKDQLRKKEFERIFQLAWKIVDSRSHVGLPHEKVKSAILPIIDLTNGLPAGCDDINVAVLTDTWDSGVIQQMMMKSSSTPSHQQLEQLSIRKSATTAVKYVDRENNHAVTALYATKDIEPGQELLLDYGELPPSSFLIKYGCIPQQYLTSVETMTDSVLLQLPPTIPVPPVHNPNRIKALKLNEFPTTRDGLKEWKLWLTPTDLQPLRQLLVASITSSSSTNTSGQAQQLQMQYYQIEPVNLKMLRQYLIVAHVGDDALVQNFLETGRLYGHLDPKELWKHIISVFDYNLSLLYDGTETSGGSGGNRNDDWQQRTCLLNNTIELQNLKQDDEIGNEDGKKMPFTQRTSTIQRILYRDALSQWRHVLCRFYGVTSHVDDHKQEQQSRPRNSSPPPPGLEYGVGCIVCGKTSPFKRCSNCKCVGYCCREHQKIHWKVHKKACSK